MRRAPGENRRFLWIALPRRYTSVMDAQTEHLAMIHRAVAGDEVSLKLLLAEEHESQCAMIASRIPAALRSTIAAEDVLQETYVQVFCHIAGFQPRDGDSFRQWVTTIAANQLRNAIKAQRTLKRGGGAAIVRDVPAALQESFVSLFDRVAGPGRTPSRSVARVEAAAAIQGALEALPEQYRQALWLVYVEGRTAASAGQQLNRSERAVHGLCRRGLSLLRERLGSASRLISFKG